MTLSQIDAWLEATKTQRDEEYEKAIHESKLINTLRDELSDEEE